MMAWCGWAGGLWMRGRPGSLAELRAAAPRTPGADPWPGARMRGARRAERADRDRPARPPFWAVVPEPRHKLRRPRSGSQRSRGVPESDAYDPCRSADEQG